MKIHIHHITQAHSQLYIIFVKQGYPIKIHNGYNHRKIIFYFLEFKL